MGPHQGDGRFREIGALISTTTFCRRNYNYQNDALGKTVGQMVGEARSARQNIVEGSSRAGTVLEKRVLGLQTIPLSGLSGRVFHVEDLQQVVGRKLAFDLKHGNVILKTDLLPQQ